MAFPRRTEHLKRVCASLLLGLGIGGAAAVTPPAAFDYWILALSWSPQHCQSNAADEQCRLPLGFIVHGLWPQYERGYPQSCSTRTRTVPRPLVERMQPLMPDTKLVQHQWRKHGSCSGLDVTEYFLNVERAWRGVVLPPALRAPDTHLRSSVRDIEGRFIEFNPRLRHDSIAVQCSGRWLREVRICMDRDFQPRSCGLDVDDRCGDEVYLRPPRQPDTRRP